MSTRPGQLHIRGLERERQPCVEPLETRTRVSPGRSWSMNCLWMGRSARAPLAVSVNTPEAAGALEGVDLELGCWSVVETRA